MKVTFPHLGNAYICVKTLLDELNIDYIIPPFNNKKALELGSLHVPESACLPLKITVGNIMEAYHQGADTVLMAGGKGPCRFGYYCEMQREILEDAGCGMDVITLEAPGNNLFELARRIKKLAGGIRLLKLLKAAAQTARISKKVDELESFARIVRCREIKKGDTDRLYNGFLEKVLGMNGYRQIAKLINETMKQLSLINLEKEKKPLKVGIVGEIYTTIDQYTNFNIEKKLGDMGVEAHRYVTVSQWIYEHMIKKSLHLPRDMKYARAAKPYLGKLIGGHARETLGNTVLYAGDGYDGVIQTYPLSCMPEIVAQSILPSIEEDFNIPVLILLIDEMTGEAGFVTRLEAFVDMLYERRKMKCNRAVNLKEGGVLE